VISRQAVGHIGETQIIASNIDYAFIVQAVGQNFNMNRLERYLVICNSSRVKPIIVLTKTDLIDEEEKEKCLEMIRERMSDIPVYAISNVTQDGYDSLKTIIKKGSTFCLLGSSGVGKSSLLNNLLGKEVMKTGSISESTNKGRHITSHRELILLQNGGILIDNPGMREVGISDQTDGLETTFDAISRLSLECKFKDCTHTNEIGCSVLEAIQNGELDQSVLDHYQKMQKEKMYFETSVVEKRKKEKAFGKMIKNYHKMNVKNDI
jgi:ribosome biogenesis GTPase